MRVLGLLVLVVNGLLHFLHVGIWQGTQAENANGIASLVDLCNTYVLDNTRNRGLHNVFKCVGHTLEHVRVDKSPDDGQESIHPLDRFGEKVRSSLKGSAIVGFNDDDAHCTHSLSTLLFAAPLDFSSTSNDFLGP